MLFCSVSISNITLFRMFTIIPKKMIIYCILFKAAMLDEYFLFSLSSLIVHCSFLFHTHTHKHTLQTPSTYHNSLWARNIQSTVFFFNGFSVANNSNGNKSFLRSFFFSLLFALYLCFTDVVAYYKFHVFFNYCIGFNSAGSSGQKTWKNRVCQRWGVQMHSKTTINILFVEWSFNFMIIIIWLMPLSDFSLLLIKHSNTNIANTIIACCRGWLNENIVIENAHVTFHSQIGWSFSCTLIVHSLIDWNRGKCFEIENWRCSKKMSR